MTNQTFSLDLIPKGIAPIVHASQYDKGQTWTINITKDGTAFTIPSGYSVMLLGTKPDGYGFEYPCTYDGSVVTVTVEQQMTAVPGDVVCELRVFDVDEIIGTLNFTLAVEEAALSDDTVISDSDISAIEQAIELVQEIPEIETELEGYVEQAEGWAKGTHNGVPVSPSDPAYEKNAKYYAEQALGMMTQAQWNYIQSLYS